MKQETLNLLELVTQVAARRDDRLTDLLRDPESDSMAGWFMHLPRCFNDALDIRQTTRQVDGKTVTVWTQGAGFAFKAGDIIYDTARAYDEWTQALQHVNHCIQVSGATDATSPRPSVSRSPGTVAFDVLVPSPDRMRLVHSASHSLTQDAFVRFLISGEGLPE